MSIRKREGIVKLEAEIRAAKGAVKTARSGYYPKLAFTGELHGVRPTIRHVVNMSLCSPS